MADIEREKEAGEWQCDHARFLLANNPSYRGREEALTLSRIGGWSGGDDRKGRRILIACMSLFKIAKSVSLLCRRMNIPTVPQHRSPAGWGRRMVLIITMR